MERLNYSINLKKQKIILIMQQKYCKLTEKTVESTKYFVSIFIL